MRILLALIISLVSGLVQAQETIVKYDDNSIPVLNEELRRTRQSSSANGISIIALQNDVTALEAMFDTSLGHDHDGTDSKKVPIANINTAGGTSGQVWTADGSGGGSWGQAGALKWISTTTLTNGTSTGAISIDHAKEYFVVFEALDTDSTDDEIAITFSGTSCSSSCHGTNASVSGWEMSGAPASFTGLGQICVGAAGTPTGVSGQFYIRNNPNYADDKIVYGEATGSTNACGAVFPNATSYWSFSQWYDKENASTSFAMTSATNWSGTVKVYEIVE